MAASQNHPFLHNKQIAIAGSGISGLAFAISLHKLWPSNSKDAIPRINIYERDLCVTTPSSDNHSISSRFDPPSSGIQILQKLGLLDRLIAVSGKHIDRETLRRQLVLAVEALPGVDLQWGNGITGATTTTDGIIELQTARLKQHADILVSGVGRSGDIRSLLRLDEDSEVPREKIVFLGDRDQDGSGCTRREDDSALVDAWTSAEKLVLRDA